MPWAAASRATRAWAFEVGRVGVGVAQEGGRAADELEDARDVPVEDGLRERPARQGGEERLLLPCHPRHQEVVSGLHLRDRVAAAEPVRHDQPVEAPVVPQDAVEERGALRRVGAVHLVVGGHDRPRVGLPHDDLEAPEVDLAQRARGDLHVDHVAVPLVVVGDEVLHRRPDALRLHAFHHGRRHPARDEGVLRVVLEVPAPERVAVDVEGGPEEDVDAVLLDLVAHGAADALDEVGVPGRGEERLDREGRAVVRARGVSLALRLDPQAGRAVGDDDRGDSEPGDGDRRPRRAGDALRGLADDRPLPVGGHAGTPHAGADDEADLLLARHRGDDVLRGALAELRQVRRERARGGRSEKGEGRDRDAERVPGHGVPPFAARPAERGGRA